MRKKSSGSHSSEILNDVGTSEDDELGDSLRKPGISGVYSRDEKTRPTPLHLHKMEEAKESGGAKKANLGIVFGVYLPTMQNIFGVLMFLRLPWIVGVMGITESFLMVFTCCLCTFLTCISMSAIATNGVVESGGSYFMISRNLGATIGTGVGILFYFANTVATSMYIVGGVEILLNYLAPVLYFGDPHHMHDMAFFGEMMFIMRLYGTALLLIIFGIVALGVKLVQWIAPISLVSVIVTVFAIYAGAFYRSTDSATVPILCLHGYAPDSDALLVQSRIWRADKNADLDKDCAARCGNLTFSAGSLECAAGITGFDADTFRRNADSAYMDADEATPGRKANTTRTGLPEKDGTEVAQGLTTTFFVMLGIYFPSVTGIMTGSNMSGDLKDPQKSIPVGTIAAQLTTTFVYLTFVLLFGGTMRRELLWDKLGTGIGNHMMVAELVHPAFFIVSIGSFGSTFGAALQSLCSAPRLLYSIANDGVIPFLSVFAKRDCRNEPVLGLLVTTAIAFLFVLLGTVDHVAPVVDSFFLLCYAFVNISCALMSFLGGPSWRPRFKFYHWSLSVLGTLLAFFCFLGNAIAHPIHGAIAILICVPTFVYISLRGSEKEWGHGVKGLYLSLAQVCLLKIGEHQPRNWRPHLLILTVPARPEPEAGEELIVLASQLGTEGKGLAMNVCMLRGDPANPEDRQRAQTQQAMMRERLERAQLAGFAKVVLSPSKRLGITLSVVLQTAGITGLKPNTLLVGWPNRWREKENEEYSGFLEQIHRASYHDLCLIVPRATTHWPELPLPAGRTIDIWWILIDGGLTLLLGYLLQRGEVWAECQLRLFAIADEAEGDRPEEIRANLLEFLDKIRIVASVSVILLRGDFDATLYTKRPEEKAEERETAIAQLSTAQQAVVRMMEPKPDDSAQGGTKETKDTTERRRKHKMASAYVLNEALVQHSAEAELVILNLPKPPKKLGRVRDYMELIELTTEGLNRVLLVRGSGREFVTIYN